MDLLENFLFFISNDEICKIKKKTSVNANFFFFQIP